MMQPAIALTKGLGKGTHRPGEPEGMAVTPASPVRWLSRESKEQKAHLALPHPKRLSQRWQGCREGGRASTSSSQHAHTKAFLTSFSRDKNGMMLSDLPLGGLTCLILIETNEHAHLWT